MTKLRHVWNDRNITLSSKVRLLRSLVISIFLYACESWTLTYEMERRIQITEMKCFLMLLISYKDHIPITKVRNKTTKAVGPHKDLLTTVKKRKLKWHGHSTRSSGLAKTIFQGTVQGKRKRGRQRRRITSPNGQERR